MTPTEQDKELRDILSKVLLDGQNQIYDLKDGKATPEQIIERMFASLDYWQPKLQQLITADRKRVELEARIDEALIADRNLGQYPDYHKMKTASLKRIDDIERGLFISVHELKAQQEEE